MCVLSIELVWVEIYGKMGEKPPFVGIFEVWYWYQTVWYQYHVFLSTGIGTEKSVPVPNVLFWTNFTDLTITWSFLIQIE